MKRAALHAALAALACASLTARCGGSEQSRKGVAASEVERQKARQEVQVQEERQTPPASASARDVSFPAISRAKLPSGLELNTVQLSELPIVNIELVLRGGSAFDPVALPGLARMGTAMLKEGTKKYSSAELAEAIDFLGARFSVGSGQETVVIRMHALSEHLDEAMALIAEVAMRPSFTQQELGKLKKRELARLSMSMQDPGYLASREFFARLYGNHPYAHIDTTAEVVNKLTRNHLARWHRTRFVPNNAFLVAVGDASAEQMAAAANRAFKGWKASKVEEQAFPAPPVRERRSVVLVDRPQSVQSVIFVGDLALERKSADYVPLLVANEVLGGSATSRLFMDLRERRGLTYGSYSSVYEKVDVAPYRVYAAVRNEATGEALGALLEHLDAISTQAAPEPELAHARRYLVDSFPLLIDTPSKIAELVAELRIFGLPDDYWEGYRSQIEQVTAAGALAAAARYFRPGQALIVVVGKAAEIMPALAKQGPVTVVDSEGKLILQQPADQPAEQPAAEQPAADAASKGDGG